jgi:hypothetical protein
VSGGGPLKSEPPGLRPRSEFSGRENAYLSGLLHEMGRAEVSRKIDEIIDFILLSELIERPLACCQMSQRPESFVNIGISIIHLLSTMLEWISELFSCSIQLSSCPRMTRKLY